MSLFCFPQSWSHQDLLSRNVSIDHVCGLAMLMFLPQRRYHHYMQTTDGITVLVTILVHYQPSCNPSHTMKVPYDTQWPTAAPQWPLVLRDVSCMQSWQLSTPSHPKVPPEWPYCWQTRCGHWFTVKRSIADLLTSSHPQISASHCWSLLKSEVMLGSTQGFSELFSSLLW